jgi:peptidoglycan hydrolase CwlO-like protein
MDKKETISNLNAKIKQREELIEVLKDRIKEVQKRLDSDVIIDLRWLREIADDKNEVIDKKAEIKQLEKEIKQLKKSVAILESNKY